MSRDPDIVVAAMISIVGGALIFQGWRLDPLLLLCQVCGWCVHVVGRQTVCARCVNHIYLFWKLSDTTKLVLAGCVAVVHNGWCCCALCLVACVPVHLFSRVLGSQRVFECFERRIPNQKEIFPSTLLIPNQNIHLAGFLEENVLPLEF